MKEARDFKLLFVYNAKAGLANSLFDSAHKMFSPSTYNCNLCDITFDVFTENKVWRKFREETDLQLEFLHKNEFLEQFPEQGKEYGFPLILNLENNQLSVFMPVEEVNKLKDAKELIAVIRSKV